MTDHLAPRVEAIEERLDKSDLRHDRIEKAIFGMQDPDTLVWIPGILQNTADIAHKLDEAERQRAEERRLDEIKRAEERKADLERAQRWKNLGLTVGGTIASAALLNVLKNYGVSDWMLQLLSDIVNAITAAGGHR